MSVKSNEFKIRIEILNGNTDDTAVSEVSLSSEEVNKWSDPYMGFMYHGLRNMRRAIDTAEMQAEMRGLSLSAPRRG